MKTPNISRREALGLAAGAGVAVVGSGIVGAQVRSEQAALKLGDRKALHPEDLVSPPDFEAQARLSVPEEVFARIQGGDREALHRVTFRPQTCNPTLDMDLSAELLGQTLFIPLVVGPISDLGRLNPQGELAMLRGAAAANTLVVVSGRSSMPLAQVGAQANGPFWVSVYADDPEAAQQVQQSVAAGAGAVFVTVGSSYRATGPQPAAAAPIDWARVTALTEGLRLPFAVKGIRNPADATEAIRRGAQAVVVSDHGGISPDGEAPILALASVVDEVAGRVPVLVDGGIQRGNEVPKALIQGARAVLVGRPAAWGLASHGEEGVRVVLEMIQSELARSMSMIGASTPAGLRRAHIRIHERSTA